MRGKKYPLGINEYFKRLDKMNSESQYLGNSGKLLFLNIPRHWDNIEIYFLLACGISLYSSSGLRKYKLESTLGFYKCVKTKFQLQDRMQAFINKYLFDQVLSMWTTVNSEGGFYYHK